MGIEKTKNGEWSVNARIRISGKIVQKRGIAKTKEAAKILLEDLKNAIRQKKTIIPKYDIKDTENLQGALLVLKEHFVKDINLFLIIAYQREGNESYSYPVGIFDNFEYAKKIAHEESQYKNGEYEYKVYPLKINEVIKDHKNN